MRRSSQILVTGAALVLIAVLGGCGSSSGGSSSGGSSSGGSSSAPAGATPPAGGGTSVTVTEKEFSIDLSTKTFAAGAYTFAISNAGKFPHNLNVKGPGVDSAVSATVSPGSSGSLSVTLQKGSYELWCSVDGHKDQGMDVMITVA